MFSLRLMNKLWQRAKGLKKITKISWKLNFENKLFKNAFLECYETNEKNFEHFGFGALVQ